MVNSENEEAVVVEFDDNRLLSGLFGEHDRHLARIEQRLSVALIPRGNRVAIVGDDVSAGVAKAALNDLYQRLKRGLDVAIGEVDAAVRMAEALGPDADKSGNGAGTTTADDTIIRTQRRIITPRSPVQAKYVRALQDSDLTFGLGPAGTGKTYLAVAVAVSMLLRGLVDRIILTRPALEAGERLGFLPGTMDEKVDPYMRPMYDALYDMMPAEKVMRSRDSGQIEVAPLAYMRGRTLTNAFVILDEAQNTTPMQMKMFLTRLGENSRMAITGDPSQVDLPLGAQSGLVDGMQVLRGIEAIGVVEFSDVDVVRHPLVTRVVRAYDARERSLLDTDKQ